MSAGRIARCAPLVVLALLAVACPGAPGDEGGPDAGPDAGPGSDAGGQDGGHDGGSDAGPDGGIDGGHDGGPDGGVDGGHDGGPDGGVASTGCGSGGGGPGGGPADLFPCDSPWYRDVSTAAVSSSSSGIISAIGATGGWGDHTGQMSVTFDFTLLHADSSAPKSPVTIDAYDTNDQNDYYPDESDTLPNQPTTGISVPMPAGAQIEGHPGSLVCPVDPTGPAPLIDHPRLEDCHYLVVDDSRHLLFELYSSTFDQARQRWYATQESVWNLGYHYPGTERGAGCTSADAAGLSVAVGLVGLAETQAAAAVSGGLLHHALRFVLPNSRIRAAYIAPGSHKTSAAKNASGPPYGARLRLRSTFDESKVTSAGGKVLVRTLKRYGMFLADGGNDTLTAEQGSWGSLLSKYDLAAIQVGDFDVVEYDPAQVQTAGCNSPITDPLAGVAY